MVARSGKKQAGHNLARYRQYHVVGRKTPSEKEPEPPVYRMKVWAPDDVRAKSKFWFALARGLPSLLRLGCAEARAPNSPRQVLLAQAQESEENQRRDPQRQRGSLPPPSNPPTVFSPASPCRPPHRTPSACARVQIFERRPTKPKNYAIWIRYMVRAFAPLRPFQCLKTTSALCLAYLRAARLAFSRKAGRTICTRSSEM